MSVRREHPREGCLFSAMSSPEDEDWQLALVLCDSKSLVETLANSNQPDGDVHRIQSAIAELCKKKEVRIMWVPGHRNLLSNELADLEAKLGSEVAQPSVPLDSSTRAALIRTIGAVVRMSILDSKVAGSNLSINMFSP